MSEPLTREQALERLTDLVRDAERIVVFTGAGMSTESGIPDFRGPNGVWERFDPDEFRIDRFMASEEARRKYWRWNTQMYQAILEAEPNAGHLAVAELERLGRLGAVITQNVDGLHQEAGTSAERVVELHGNTRFVSCLSCGWRADRGAFQPRVSEDGEAPACDACGGLVKPATISFGQMLKPETLARAAEETDACDLFLVIGSSLVVYPAAQFPLQAVQRGAGLAILNLQDTPHDPYADVVLNASSGEVLPRVVRALTPDAPLNAPLPS